MTKQTGNKNKPRKPFKGTSIFKITPIKDKTLQKYKEEAMKDLNEFFGKNWVYNTPKIFVIDDRKGIDLFEEKETEDWVVGFSFGNRAVVILNPDNISEESCHNGSSYDIAKLIKHELCHLFFRLKFGLSNFRWINEGVSLYVAGQLDKYPMPNKFDGFLDGNVKKIYQESGNAIKLIMDNYGKDKLFEFLEKQRDVKRSDNLRRVFEEVFGEPLGYEFFNRLV